MVDNPEALLPALAEGGANGVSMHIEALDNPARALAAAAEHGLDAGLAVKPGTPLEAVLPYLDRLDLVLTMTVEPGFGGQAFDDSVLPKIAAAHRAIAGPGGRSRSRSTAASAPPRCHGAWTRAPTCSWSAPPSSAPTTRPPPPRHSGSFLPGGWLGWTRWS